MIGRNAARVLPLPVGVQRSRLPPRAMLGQAKRWGAVGSPNVAANQARSAGARHARAESADGQAVRKRKGSASDAIGILVVAERGSLAVEVHYTGRVLAPLQPGRHLAALGQE